MRITGGGVHVPLRTCSPGRYVRITILNVFDTEVAGARSQLDSLSAPGKVRNKLRDSDLEKIVCAFKNYKDLDRYCHIADFDELKENEFNLNVPRYVDISESEEEVDIQKTIDDLKKLEKERQELEIQVYTDLKELGFTV